MSTDLHGLDGTAEVALAIESSGRSFVFGADSPLSGSGKLETVRELDRATLRVRVSSAELLERLDFEARIGDVPVASTSPDGLEKVRLERSGPMELMTPTFLPFADAAGVSCLDLWGRRRDDDGLLLLARLWLKVLPEKITAAELERLIGEIEEASSALLFDAYSKTYLGLRGSRRIQRRPPAEAIEGIRGAMEQFGIGLARISRRPAQRLTLRPRRVGIYPGEPITPETLLEISEDPSLLTQTRSRVLPRERIEMAAERDVRLPEHAAFSGFLASLAEETREALLLIQKEVKWRLDQRLSFAEAPGGTWAQREEPRIVACQALESRARALLSRVRDLRRRYDFLPPEARPLRAPPELTKRFAQVGAYAMLYRVMREHYLGRERDFEDWGGLAGAKSLPVLWEQWVVLQTLGFLQRRLRFARSPWETREGLLRRLVGAKDRFVLDLSADRSLEFVDGAGRRLLFRYQPRYPTVSGAHHARNRGIGRLKRRGAPYEPDIALELFAAGAAESASPEHIVVLDAKYSARSPEELLQSLLRYRNIGEIETGRRLVRQIWAVTCSGAETVEHGWKPSLERCVTVDNECFFEPTFSAQAEACGVIALKPGSTRGQSPLDLLLARLCSLFGIG